MLAFQPTRSAVQGLFLKERYPGNLQAEKGWKEGKIEQGRVIRSPALV